VAVDQAPSSGDNKVELILKWSYCSALLVISAEVSVVKYFRTSTHSPFQGTDFHPSSLYYKIVCHQTVSIANAIHCYNLSVSFHFEM